jgi:lysophospholipase L1-like esterase
MNLKYYLGAILALPFLPVMYIQGKKIKRTIPDLPEAEGPNGLVSVHGQKKLRLGALGESTIAGVGVSDHSEGFISAIAEGLSMAYNVSIEWDIYAQSGYTARQVREKLVPLTASGYDLIIIGLGGNDTFKLHSPNTWRTDITELIDSIKGIHGDTPIVFTNMPPIRDFQAFTPLLRSTMGGLVELLGEELEKITHAYHHVFYNSEAIRLEDWLTTIKGTTVEDFFSDGVHPSKLTYQLWGKAMASFIIDLEKTSKLMLKT